MAQTEEFKFQNVAYWPTVNKTGHLTIICLGMDIYEVHGLVNLHSFLNPTLLKSELN